jgi:hypothetical protein
MASSEQAKPDQTGASDGEAVESGVAEELHRLNEQVAALQGELRRLGAGPLPPAALDRESSSAPSFEWVGSLEPPLRRRPAVPRFLLEAAFLVAAAALAAAADLDPLVIAAVMAGAWVIVALAEWAASRAERRREELLLAPPPVPVTQKPADPAWFSPPVEHTRIDVGSDSATAVTRLPPVADEATVEHGPVS